jgi:hypothetical protein
MSEGFVYVYAVIVDEGFPTGCRELDSIWTTEEAAQTRAKAVFGEVEARTLDPEVEP